MKRLPLFQPPFFAGRLDELRVTLIKGFTDA